MCALDAREVVLIRAKGGWHLWLYVHVMKL